MIPKMRRQKRPDGNDMALVELSGERHYLGKWKSKDAKDEYERVVAEWIARGRKPKPPTDDALIVECCDAYTDHCRDYFKDSPKSFDRILLALRPLLKLYGRMTAAEFGAVHLRAVRETMINDGLSLTSINTRINIIRRMLRHCASIEMVPAEPWHKAATLENLKPGRTAAKAPKKIDPVPTTYVDAVKPFVTQSVRGLMELQLLTGARSGELLQLKAADIDMTGNVWVVELKRHKNAWRGQGRTLYIGSKGQSVLKPFLLRRRADEYLFQPSDYYQERSHAADTHRRPNQLKNIPKTDRVCGECYDAGSYRKAITRACDEAKVPHWHPHQLRHTCASEMRKQFGVEAVRALLGHSCVDTTELYAQIDGEQAKRIAAAVG
jgi:integrase